MPPKMLDQRLEVRKRHPVSSAVLPGGFRLQDFLFEILHLGLQFVDKAKTLFPLRITRHLQLDANNN